MVPEDGLPEQLQPLPDIVIGAKGEVTHEVPLVESQGLADFEINIRPDSLPVSSVSRRSMMLLTIASLLEVLRVR